MGNMKQTLKKWYLNIDLKAQQGLFKKNPF